MLKNNLGFRIKYKSRYLLNEINEKFGGNGIYNIKNANSKKGKNALIIYTAEVISNYLRNKVSSFKEFNSHSGFQESIAMLELLTDLGYTVDYFHLVNTPKIDWQKYELIIDASGNIQHSKHIVGQKLIYYSTSCHWKTFLNNALVHSNSFYERNKILLYPDRIIEANYSDEAANIITCFGGLYQKNSFLEQKHKVQQIKISTNFTESNFKKKIGSKKKFLWFSGHGPFHKGLDIVTEAFLRMPDKELHIFGNIELNVKMFKWFNTVTNNSKNIFYHGWGKLGDTKLNTAFEECDAFVYASSSEGGAGSAIVCMQMGLIPIINASTAIDLEENEFGIQGIDPSDQIESIIKNVSLFSKKETEELQQKSNKLSTFYMQNNNISAYKNSLTEVINS